MLYLLSALAVGAVAEINTAGDKILYNGHGFTAGQHVVASGDFGGGVTSKNMYVIKTGATDNEFQLTTPDFDTLAAGKPGQKTLVGFANTDSTPSAKLMKGGAKVCKLKSSTNGNNKVTCAGDTSNFTAGQKLLIFCQDRATANACKIDGNVEGKDGPSGVAGTLDHLAEVYPTAATAGAFKLQKDVGGTKTDIEIGADMPAASQNKIWLVSDDNHQIYPTAHKALKADAGKWKNDHFFCPLENPPKDAQGKCPSPISSTASPNKTMFFYKAGNPKTVGLTDKTVYATNWVNTDPWKFSLSQPKTDGTSITTAGADAVTGITAPGGKGDEYHVIDQAERLVGSLNTGNKIIFHTDKNTLYPAETAVIFYCASTTPAECDYKVTNMTHGAEFKIKEVTAEKAVLKGTTGTDAIPVTGDTTAKTKGYLLRKKAGSTVWKPQGNSDPADDALLGDALTGEITGVKAKLPTECDTTDKLAAETPAKCKKIKGAVVQGVCEALKASVDTITCGAGFTGVVTVSGSTPFDLKIAYTTKKFATAAISTAAKEKITEKKAAIATAVKTKVTAKLGDAGAGDVEITGEVTVAEPGTTKKKDDKKATSSSASRLTGVTALAGALALVAAVSA